MAWLKNNAVWYECVAESGKYNYRIMSCMVWKSNRHLRAKTTGCTGISVDARLPTLYQVMCGRRRQWSLGTLQQCILMATTTVKTGKKLQRKPNTTPARLPSHKCVHLVFSKALPHPLT